jgi:hypothetical protein
VAPAPAIHHVVRRAGRQPAGVIEDPNVSVFNVLRFFFLNVLTRACAEYINFVAALPGAEDLSDPAGFLAKAEQPRLCMGLPLCV